MGVSERRLSDNLEYTAPEIQISQHPGRVRVRVNRISGAVYSILFLINTDGKNAAVNLCQSQVTVTQPESKFYSCTESTLS